MSGEVLGSSSAPHLPHQEAAADSGKACEAAGVFGVRPRGVLPAPGTGREAEKFFRNLIKST